MCVWLPTRLEAPVCYLSSMTVLHKMSLKPYLCERVCDDQSHVLIRNTRKQILEQFFEVVQLRGSLSGLNMKCSREWIPKALNLVW